MHATGALAFCIFQRAGCARTLHASAIFVICIAPSVTPGGIPHAFCPSPPLTQIYASFDAAPARSRALHLWSASTPPLNLALGFELA